MKRDKASLRDLVCAGLFEYNIINLNAFSQPFQHPQNPHLPRSLYGLGAGYIF